MHIHVLVLFIIYFFIKECRELDSVTGDNFGHALQTHPVDVHHSTPYHGAPGLHQRETQHTGQQQK